MRAVPPSCVNVATFEVVVSVPVDSEVARRTTEASKRPRLKVNAPVLVVLVVPPVKSPPIWTIEARTSSWAPERLTVEPLEMPPEER